MDVNKKIKKDFSVESDEEGSSSSLSPLQRDRCNTWPRILLERYNPRIFCVIFKESLYAVKDIDHPKYPMYVI